MNNPIQYLCDALENVDLEAKAKSELRNEIDSCLNDLIRYFDDVVDGQWYYSTTPKSQWNSGIMCHIDTLRRFEHDDCIAACAKLNEICKTLGVAEICDFATDDRMKVAEFVGCIVGGMYFSNIRCSEKLTDWWGNCPYAKHSPEEYKTVGVGEVFETASGIMARFDEAFKELAK